MYCRASSCVVKTVFGEGFTLDFYKTRAEITQLRAEESFLNGKKVDTKMKYSFRKKQF